MTKRDSTNVKNGFLAALLALATLAISPGAIAGAPTLISSATGKYCYDFGNYIPSTDSPVVGGVWRVKAELEPVSSYPMLTRPAIFGFGKACFSTPLSWSASPVNSPTNGRLLPYTSSNYSDNGAWFYYFENTGLGYKSCGCSGDSGGTCYCATTVPIEAPLLCQANHAVIKTTGYVRSDGVSKPTQPIHPYDAWESNYAYSATNAVSAGVYVYSSAYSGWLEPNPNTLQAEVCVKTDTSQ